MTAMTQQITLLNASYEVLSANYTEKKAARLLALGKVIIDEADPIRKLGAWAYPKVLRLKYYVRIAHEALNGPPRVSKRGVLLRDKYVCAYCGGEANTIDHIVPRSAPYFGKNTWQNLTAACGPCNRKKGNRTLEQMGWTLYRKPSVPKRSDLRI